MEEEEDSSGAPPPRAFRQGEPRGNATEASDEEAGTSSNNNNNNHAPPPSTASGRNPEEDDGGRRRGDAMARSSSGGSLASQGRQQRHRPPSHGPRAPLVRKASFPAPGGGRRTSPEIVVLKLVEGDRVQQQLHQTSPRATAASASASSQRSSRPGSARNRGGPGPRRSWRRPKLEAAKSFDVGTDVKEPPPILHSVRLLRARDLRRFPTVDHSGLVI